jgi:hypothetical protein
LHIVALGCFFLMDQRRRIRGLYTIGGQNIQRGDDLAVRVHGHIDQIAHVELAMLAVARVRIVHADQLIARFGIGVVGQQLARHNQRTLHTLNVLALFL